MKKRKRRWLTPNQRSELHRLWVKGQSLVEVARTLDVTRHAVERALDRSRGFAPRNCRSARALSESDREEISRCLAMNWSIRAIARKLGRAASTISREVNRNCGRHSYRANSAERRAWKCARRPKPCKLLHKPRLCRIVETKLRAWWSPQQVSEWLRRRYPRNPSMHVSHETLYRTLFIQARGALKAELRSFLRAGHKRRRPHRETKLGTASIVDGISISERPPEVEDRAVPGHWEGDLLFGTVNSYIATLVERQTRYCVLVKVPSKDTREVTAAIQKQISRLPKHLLKSLTWDRGSEMSGHKDFTVATNIPVYFADPRSPWQRGTNENTNGLLRQWFPNGTDFDDYNQAELDRYAYLLNSRPRKTLDYRTPADQLSQLLR